MHWLDTLSAADGFRLAGLGLAILAVILGHRLTAARAAYEAAAREHREALRERLDAETVYEAIGDEMERHAVDLTTLHARVGWLEGREQERVGTLQRLGLYGERIG